MKHNMGLSFIVGLAGLAVLAALPSAADAAARRRAASPLPPGARVIRDIEYVPGGHERQKLDLYLPGNAGKPRPVVVWIHGGGWRGGSKDRSPAVLLVEKGFAVASINYRLSQHAVFPAQLHDCKAAVRWLRAHHDQYRLDAHHIGAWGSSAGGHLAALLGTTGDDQHLEGLGGNLDQSSRVQAVVDWFGPANFLTIAAKDTRTALLGGDPQENRQLAALASPAHHASAGDAPFLIQHGDADITVPISQSQELLAVLQKAGVEAQLTVIAGAAHGQGPQFMAPENLAIVTAFFRAKLTDP